MRIRLASGAFLAIAMAATVPAAWGQPTEMVNGVALPDAQRTRVEFGMLLTRMPPNVATVLALDPSLLSNEAFMSSYPGLASFAKAHPEIQKNAGFYLPPPERHERNERGEMLEFSRDILTGLAVFTGMSIAASILIWLIRTVLDHRRWSRMAKAQTEFQSKMLDRFAGNSELMAYIQSPAGQKLLESSPINLDPAPRSTGAPLGRILWSLQVGCVLLAAGIGLQVASGQIIVEAAQPLHVLGVLLYVALGGGFIVSAGASFVISNRLGLIDSARRVNSDVA